MRCFTRGAGAEIAFAHCPAGLLCFLYFDHPLLGILVLVTRLEGASAPPEPEPAGEPEAEWSDGQPVSPAN